MRTVARSAPLLFGHRCHVAALLSSMTCHRENHVTTSSGTFPRKRQRKQKRNKSLLKRTLPRPQGLVGAAGKVCRGLSGAWELQGRVCGVLASFEGWQTTAWDLRKRTLPRPQGLVGAAGKVCRGLSGSWELQEGLGSFEGWQTAALNVHKKTLPRPQGLVGAAGKVCRGLSGAWELGEF